MPPTVIVVDAILFDMDGTLIDSTNGVEGAWRVFQQSYPHIDVHDILSSAHGVRTVDNLKKYCGIDDPDELETEALRFEQAIIDSSREAGQGIVALPGVARVMEQVGPGAKLPNPCWAICTSATRAYASAALESAGIPVPDVFVVAEDVERGKPYPDPYLLASKLCGVDPKRCLVFEDAPNGIRSGQAAGCQTVGFLTTHSKEEVESCKPDFLVPNMASISMRRLEQGGVEVTIEQ